MNTNSDRFTYVWYLDSNTKNELDFIRSRATMIYKECRNEIKARTSVTKLFIDRIATTKDVDDDTWSQSVIDATSIINAFYNLLTLEK